ncbi:MAG: sterol desaturase family protein [Microthrixaceae bacterium]
MFHTARQRAALLYGGAATSALAAPGIKRLLSRVMPRPAADALAIGGLSAGWWVLISRMEKAHPFREDWNRDHGDTRTDVADLVVSGGVGRSVAAAVTAPLTSAITTRRNSKRGPISELPYWVQAIILVLAFDLGHYTLHRIMHEHIGWRFHAPHHSSTRLYWGNATRFHPVEYAMDGAHEFVTLALLGPSSDANTAFSVFRGSYGQIQHANIDLDSGVLNEFLATAERHRWHHSTAPEEGNSNYGAIVAVWDRLFGSAAVPERPFDAEIGIDDPDYPTSYVGQLVAPITG